MTHGDVIVSETLHEKPLENCRNVALARKKHTNILLFSNYYVPLSPNLR